MDDDDPPVVFQGVFNLQLSKPQRGKSFKVLANRIAGPGICDPLKEVLLNCVIRIPIL